MHWRDRGILLSSRNHGETSAILEVFTSVHGRHAGVLRGGMSRRYRPILQPGTEIVVEWRARLPEHIGAYRIEPARSRPAALMADRMALAALSSLCAVLSMSLPEREPNPQCYGRTVRLLDALESSPDWLGDYLMWEFALLGEIGFGLDLERCVVTGTTGDLVYVSPKSGCAVSRRGAGKWADRMLPLPPCFLGKGNGDIGEVSDGLRTVGHFLRLGIMKGGRSASLPQARMRFAESVRQMAERAGQGTESR